MKTLLAVFAALLLFASCNDTTTQPRADIYVSDIPVPASQQ